MLNTTEADNKSNLFILRLLVPQNYREKVIGLFFRRYRNLKLHALFRSFLNIGITHHHALRVKTEKPHHLPVGLRPQLTNTINYSMIERVAENVHAHVEETGPPVAVLSETSKPRAVASSAEVSHEVEV